MNRIGQDVLRRWVSLLSTKVDKSEEVLLEKGLPASDFNCSTKVVLENPGEMECVFHNAFSIVDPKSSRVAVFTEHIGYHEFYLNGLKVSEITSEEYWDEDYQP